MQNYHHYSAPAKLSKHAMVRMQQRSIPHFIVDLLLELTTSSPAGGRFVVYRFDAESWAEAKRAIRHRSQEFDRYRNTYVVVAEDGTVVTVARLH